VEEKKNVYKKFVGKYDHKWGGIINLDIKKKSCPLNSSALLKAIMNRVQRGG
jgi:hypothetical protein